jgi:N-hydroxyarylamine O-acetyltransferase
MPGSVDLDAYLARIAFEGPARPDLPTLQALHLAHATHIPFENLDIQMGLPILLDLEALQDKLVRRRRGGYCFEQNSLFLAVLRAIGFDAVAFEARVRLGMTEVRPRTHMLLRVGIGGEALLADVGFGGQGLLLSLPMDCREHAQFDDVYRVQPEGSQLVLQWRSPEGWLDLYSFVPEERYPVDFEMGSHFTSTYPGSRFVQSLTAQLPTPEARHVLRNLTYTVVRAGATEERTLTVDELLPLLRQRFGIELPDDVRFRCLAT